MKSDGTRGKLAIVWNAGYFDEYGNACREWLANVGWRVDSFKSFEGTESHDAILVVGISFYARVPLRLGQYLIGIQSEQMPLSDDNDWSLLRNLARYRGVSRYYDLLIEWSPSNYIRCPRPRRTRYLPHGSAAPTTALSADAVKQYDILFLGNPVGSNNRRGELLDRLKARYRVCPVHSAWGARKYDLIQKSAVCLNLHQFESKSFESPRIFELLASGAFVLSECIDNSFPFQAGEHYVSFKGFDDVCDIIDHFLVNDQARQQIATQGQTVALRYSFEHVIGQIVLEIDALPISRRIFVHRFWDWCLGRLGMASIDFIDVLAAARRRVFLRG